MPFGSHRYPFGLAGQLLPLEHELSKVTGCVFLVLFTGQNYYHVNVLIFISHPTREATL